MKNMKTTLKEKLNTASSAIQTQGQKAFKHPITSILSLCLVAGIAATIAGFSQAPMEENVALSEKPASVAAPAGTTLPLNLPVARTLTSADGRTIDVTILSKSDTAIKAKKADGKEFEITLDKLSEADREFVAGLVDAPVKKIKVLTFGTERLIPNMENDEFEITILNDTNDLESLSDQELESFDAILTAGPSNSEHGIQVDRLIKWTHDEKIIVWRHYYKIDKREFINKKLEPTLFKGKGEMRDQEPFINVQGNTIFYSPTKYNFKKGGDEILDENILDQVFIELKQRIQKKVK
jgi:hypothetical protein